MNCVYVSSLLILALGLGAAEPEYSRDINKWQEVAVPSVSDKGARMVWFHSANSSKWEWRVYAEGSKVFASTTHSAEATRERPGRPKFTPKADKWHGGSAFFPVDDGWLVGFNQGEFGAALYWFSVDGQQSYRISDHQVVDFFSLSNGVHAIEGLAHMGVSKGSVIRIERPKAGARWQAVSVAKLPFAPYAVSLRRDGTALIALSDSLVSAGPDGKVHTLLANAPWEGFYPNSSIISPDEQRLYIGMRQFVGEFDLRTSKLRLLIPSREFLNKLHKEDEERIRK